MTYPLTLILADNIPSDSEFSRHYTLIMDHAGQDVGTLLITVVDYAAIEGQLTSHRWVTREETYLGSFRRTLFNPGIVRAKIHPDLKELRGSHGKLVILDDILLDEKNFEMADLLHPALHAIRDCFHATADFIVQQEWMRFVTKHELPISHFLQAFGPMSATPPHRAFISAKLDVRVSQGRCLEALSPGLL